MCVHREAVLCLSFSQHVCFLCAVLLPFFHRVQPLQPAVPFVLAAAYAACPWQALLSPVDRLEPPDHRDPVTLSAKACSTVAKQLGC